MAQVSTVRINGAELRRLRTRRGLSVAQLAARAGRHAQSVRRLETDRPGKLASEVFAYQLANALGEEDPSAFTLPDGDAADGPGGEGAVA